MLKRPDGSQGKVFNDRMRREEYKNNTDSVMELGENVGKIPDKYLKAYEIFEQLQLRKAASLWSAFLLFNIFYN